MKIVLAIVPLLFVGVIEAKSPGDYLQEAQSQFDAKEFDQAIITMEMAAKEHPNNPIIYDKLGFYIAETATGYVDLFIVLPRAFAMWDTAIALDPSNVDARFNRGTWGTYVPQSIGQLDKAIIDLEYVVETLEKSVNTASQKQLVEALSALADGYRKRLEVQKARTTYAKVIEIAPEARTARHAQNYIDVTNHFEKWSEEREQQGLPDSPEISALRKKTQKKPDDVGLLLLLGNMYLEANKDEAAAEVFERVVAADTMNLKAHKMLAFALKRIFQAGYDPRISMDHNYRTDLGFRMMRVMDRAVSIAPEDVELRLMRGTAGVEAFFFMERMDQAIKDLQMVIDGDASDAMKAAARYQLGRARQKKAHSHWLKIFSEYPESQAVDSVFKELKPDVKHIDISEYKTPVVIIDFVLGFRDELAPQTALWVEDKEGKFIKTIYVSGFSGYARSMGRIPHWTATSEFADADAVTGASIDLGHHIYTWDLADVSGKKVNMDDYVLKVETAYWPSRQYQIVEARITIGTKPTHVVVEEGNVLPYVKVQYRP